MNILKLLWGRTKMTTAMETQISTGERLKLLQARHAELQTLIKSGEAGEEAIIEEQRVLQQVIAASQVHEQATASAHRDKVNGETQERRERLNPVLDKLAMQVPEMLLTLGDFTRIADEIQIRGMGFEGGLVEDICGLPPDFGSRVSQAIRDAAPRTIWDYSATGIFSTAKPERPRTQPAPGYHIDLQRYQPAPPGFSGLWNRKEGRPAEEPALAVFHVPPSTE